MRKAMLALLVLGVGVMTSFSNPILAGDTLIREAIESENYDPGVAGWQIARDGTAEFNDVTARGTITASEVDVDLGGEGRIQIGPGQLGFGPRIDLEIGQDHFDTQFGVGNAVETSTGSIVPDVSSAWWAADIIFQTSRIDSNQAGVMTLYSESGDNAGASYKPARLFLSQNTALEAPRMRLSRDASSTDIDITSLGSAGSFRASGFGVSFTAPPSGLVTVTIFDRLFLETTTTSQRILNASIQVREGSTVGSGSVVKSPSVDDGLTVTQESVNPGRTSHSASAHIEVSGLTPGDSYNVEIMYQGSNFTSVGRAESIARKVQVRPEM